jgi:hypothetical protein
MKCGKCDKEIRREDGYFTTFLYKGRVDFHIPCKPEFSYEQPVDPKQVDLPFKELPK